MKKILPICRIILGAVFIFSGFVKGIDPLGSAYKFTDYFNAWGMEFLIPFALPLGVLLSLAEFGLGLSLILNTWKRFTAWASWIFMAFFLVVTLVVAINNPVEDCGCFGDALKITNWETFYKNIVLFLFATIVLIGQTRAIKANAASKNNIICLSLVAIYLVLVWYSYQHLPIIDFRPYKVGNSIVDGMSIPEDAAADVYENTFIYKNKSTGETENFTEENYPWQDTINWEYVDMESTLVKEGYTPPIKDFFIMTSSGEDIKDFFLYDDYCTFMLISKSVEEADWAEADGLKELITYSDKQQMSFIGLTASDLGLANRMAASKDLDMEFFNNDEITLKTIIRANPGLMLTRRGVILGKWNLKDIPSPSDIDELLEKLDQQ